MEIDRVNNITQKESALAASGVTRRKYMKVIAEALEATKEVEGINEQGNLITKTVDDISRRQWGAEQAARLFADMGMTVESLDMALVNTGASIERLIKMKMKKRDSVGAEKEQSKAV